MDCLSVLGQDGLLSQVINGFIPRNSQIEMAKAVSKAMQVQASLIVEAGTGTGKTFAYLIPAFINQKKTIISTGTKNLQDQLFFKDIPILKKIFPGRTKVVLLKGRSNYACLHRIEQNILDGRFSSKKLVSELHEVKEWSQITKSGDIAELNTVAEDSAIWPIVTSTADNCLGQECEFYKDCFVAKVRKTASDADIVIINHHLYFADLSLQEAGFGEILPAVESVIFDEAHHLPDIASQFFSTRITSRQLIELAKDTEIEIAKDASDIETCLKITDNLQYFVHELRRAFGSELKKSPWPKLVDKEVAKNIEFIKNNLSDLEKILHKAQVSSKALENCYKRTIKLIENFSLLTGETPDDTVHWYETYAQSFSIQFTPIVVADEFKQHMKLNKRSWVFTSATLTVKKSFSLFVNTMGLEDSPQMQLLSPFDYKKQALLYVPRGLPDARDPVFVDKMVDSVIPILNASQGKAFILFTSFRSLSYASELLQEKIDFPILVQGSMPKMELIEKFKELGNAVLMGTSSFWYGVDVRGDALSCVIIDKLPFASPDDPILQAKINLLKRKNIDPFQDLQLPSAVLMLKQGVGRLIRDVKDRGVLVLCDPRIVGNRYGETFLNSLPKMLRTRELNKVREFFSI